MKTRKVIGCLLEMFHGGIYIQQDQSKYMFSWFDQLVLNINTNISSVSRSD